MIGIEQYQKIQEYKELGLARPRLLKRWGSPILLSVNTGI